MKTIDYSPSMLGYIVYPSEKEITLKQKVSLIEDINTIQQTLGKETMNVEQFDFLYDSPVKHLIRMVQDQSELLTGNCRRAWF